MRWLPGWQALRRIGTSSADHEVERELAFHFDEKVQEFVSAGMSEADAHARAVEEFGDVDTVRAQLRVIDERVALKRRRAEWHEAVLQDLGYVLRTLRRAPGFTLMVVLTLSLGIGANAALFSLLDRLYLRDPAGVTGAGSLKRLYQATHGRQDYLRQGFNYLEIEAVRNVSQTDARIAAYTAEKVSIGREVDAPQRKAAYVAYDYFGVLGVRPALGRFFAGLEQRIDGLTPVAVLSHSLWRAQYGGDSAIIGRVIDLGSHRYTVIGVAAPGFRGVDLDATDLWLPLNSTGTWKGRSAEWYRDPNANGIRALVRHRDASTVPRFNARATTTLRTLAILDYPQSETFLGSLHEARVNESRNKESAISLRLGGVAMVILLIACANVVNLLLARGMRRRREIALRLALGVSRRRLVAQLITESGVLALIAAVVSLGVALGGASLLRALLLPGVQWTESPVTSRVVYFTMAVALAVGFLAGLVPALRASRPAVARSLRSGAREGTYHRSRLRTGLLVVQAAMSVMLLAGAGVFLRSLHEVERVDVGYATDRLFFPYVGYDRELEDHRQEIADRTPALAARIREMPGVEAVGLVSNAPMYGFSFEHLALPDRDSLPPSGGMERIVTYVSPEYFSTVGMRVLRGRAFTADDRYGAPMVLAMNETMARNLWPGEDPLTKCVIVGEKNRACRQVVAIVSHAHFSSILEGPSMEYYVPLAQSGRTSLVTMAVRTVPGQTARISSEAKKLIRLELGSWSRPRMIVMSEQLAPELRPYRMGAALFSAAGMLALLVAAVGVYSSLAYTISQRTHEMGVRMALGARALDIVRLVVGDGVRTVLVGLAIGIAASLALGRVVAALLYNTSPRDPAVLGTVAMLLLAVAVIACLVPAWRAARADPMNALRAE